MKILGRAGLLAAALPAAALANPNGMTWTVTDHDSVFGVDTVDCWAGVGNECDAYHGDTACTERLPILCLGVDGAQNPGVATDPYHEWAYGHIALTQPIRGDKLTSWKVADQICKTTFGPEWKMAEHHDANMWALKAFGFVRTDTRFWVAINDQPANCWD